MQNPFKNLTEQEKAEREIKSKELDLEVSRLAELGRTLLNDERYKKFRETFNSLAVAQMNALVYYEGGDMRTVMRLQERLRVFKSLIDLPIKAIEQERIFRGGIGERVSL